MTRKTLLCLMILVIGGGFFSMALSAANENGLLIEDVIVEESSKSPMQEKSILRIYENGKTQEEKWSRDEVSNQINHQVVEKQIAPDAMKELIDLIRSAEVVGKLKEINKTHNQPRNIHNIFLENCLDLADQDVNRLSIFLDGQQVTAVFESDCKYNYFLPGGGGEDFEELKLLREEIAFLAWHGFSGQYGAGGGKEYWVDKRTNSVVAVEGHYGFLGGRQHSYCYLGGAPIKIDCDAKISAEKCLDRLPLPEGKNIQRRKFQPLLDQYNQQCGQCLEKRSGFIGE